MNGTTPSGFFKKEIENIILKAFEKAFKKYLEHLTKNPSQILYWILGVAARSGSAHEKILLVPSHERLDIFKKGYSAPFLLLPKQKSTNRKPQISWSGSAARPEI
jgi:hypothetical protein